MARKINGAVARQAAINLSAQTANNECSHPEICDGTRRGCMRGGECFTVREAAPFRPSIWHVVGPAILGIMIVFAAWSAFG